MYFKLSLFGEVNYNFSVRLVKSLITWHYAHYA